MRWFCAVAAVSVTLVGMVNRHSCATTYPQIYWSDRVADTIQVADPDGTNVREIISGRGQLRGIDLDLQNEKIYWADNGTNKIQRANLDGTMIEDLVTAGLNFPAGIALNVPGNKMYWADTSNHKIQRADLNGQNVEDLVTGLGSPYFVTLDEVNDKVYWTDYGTDKIQRANFDGSSVEDLVTTGLDLTRGIDLDIEGGKMYWADRGTDKLQRANLADGSQIEDLVTILPPPRVDAAPHGVALDVDAGHMYWVDNGTQKVQRANLDGTDMVDLITVDNGVLNKPWQIVLDLGPQLQAGDANQDLVFDQLDIVQVSQASQYLSGQPATWGEGDWDAAPGGRPDLPPMGDGRFDQKDIVAALSTGLYLDGPHNAHPANAPIDDNAPADGLLAGGGAPNAIAPAAVPVPEPSTCGLAIFAAFCVSFGQARARRNGWSRAAFRA